MQLDVGLIKELLDLSLKEDYAIRGDITSNALLEHGMRASFEIVARQEIILSGIDIVEYFLVNYYSFRDFPTVIPDDTIVKRVVVSTNDVS